jgi:hypothetical protein
MDKKALKHLGRMSVANLIMAGSLLLLGQSRPDARAELDPPGGGKSKVEENKAKSAAEKAKSAAEKAKSAEKSKGKAAK